MSRANASLRRDDRAETTAMSTALMAGIAVALVVGGSVVANQIYQAAEEGGESTTASALARVDGFGRHELGLQTGSLPTTDTKLNLVIDGQQQTVPLSWFRDRGVIGNTWTVGQWLCLVGDDDNCYSRNGDEVVAGIRSPGAAPIQLGLLSGSHASADNDIVKIVGKRASFLIDDIGNIVTQAESQVYMQIIGTEITYGAGGPNIPVYAKPSLDGGATTLDVFGGVPVSRGMVHNLGLVDPGAVLGAEGRAYLPAKFDATYNSWSGDPHVVTLRDGDAVPTTPGWQGQVPISAMLGPYADLHEDGVQRVSLDENEVLLLFEFTSDLSSQAADFQDLIVVFSIDPLPLQGLGIELPGPGTSTLICVQTAAGPATLSLTEPALSQALLAGGVLGPCDEETRTELPKPDEKEELKTTLCHIPPGHPEKAKTLTVGDRAVPAHLAHGDLLGACPLNLI